ncbi:E3 ubiquitin-protein ligase RNF123-like isoform X1 [Polistes fuscatus]|uniref:E3 ubiquitin-protein ligase RNF123-like isoform X1 n=1 Tax=Polistes fuscatus TaxID=30207 RepID=UPI001CAA1647|nr:E3 ubiquitin-protein ligase RNF123-like isoform X1 [Polistes fuscatus]
MEAEVILQNIFGKYNVMEMRKTLPNTSNTNILSTTDSIEIVKTFFRYTLVQSVCGESLIDDRIGRIGPKEVKFDRNNCVGLFLSSSNGNSVISQGNFCTVPANTGIYKDKWMYEVQLGSKGIMQIGWGTLNCKYNVTTGVGDTSNSYSYDGSRIKKWNVIPSEYGELWLPGDIIGCTLDMNEGIISYYRNGRSLGKAFENISMGPGIAYFPTISLTFGESLTAIFGDIPFRYPIEDYQPIQAPPEIEISQASFIIHWINQILDYMIHLNGTTVLADNSMTVQAYLNCILEDLIKQLSPLLSIQYIIEVVFIPFLYDITNIRSVGAMTSLNSNKDRIKVMTFLDLLWTFLDYEEVKLLLENVISLLYSLFRHISFQPEYSKQYDILALLINLCLHTPTRHFYLNYELFDRVRFFNFIYIKPMDDMSLENIIHEPWWETNPTDEVINSRKIMYFKACDNIKLLIKDLEMMQVLFIKILLKNNDGTTTKASSRSIFLKKFQSFVYENFFRTTPQLHHVPLALSLCSFHRLLTAFRDLWNEEIGINNVHIPCSYFYDGTINYFNIDRLGGVLSYLRKTYKLELMNILGRKHKVIDSIEQSQNRSRSARRGNFRTSTSLFGHRNVENDMEIEYIENENQLLPTLESANEPNSLLILLDSLILFYHTIVKKQVSKLSGLQENIIQFSTALSESKKRMISITNYHSDLFEIIKQELLNTLRVYEKKLCELSRQMVWVRATVFSEQKVAQIGWFLNVVATTLCLAGKEGNMFSFVPEFYLEALSDLCKAVRTEIHPIMPLQVIPDYPQILLQISEFLCRHFMNPLIINVNSKETLLLIFAGFVSHPLTLNTLENVTLDNRLRVIRNLLKPSENKCWAHSSWILMRFWQGHGFAFRYEQTPHLNKISGLKSIRLQNQNHPKPCPSLVFQLHIRDRLLGKSRNTELFLNCILNQINWAFSEFIGMIQEIYNCSLSTERIFIDSRQLRICSTCFEVTVTSLRVLEMFCFLAPTIFTNDYSNCETLLCRLFQLLCQILNRMSSKNNTFQEVLSWSISDLASLDYFPILTAVIGILLLILKKDMSFYKQNPKMIVSRVTRLLLIEPSFQMSSLYFVLGEINPLFPEKKDDCIERFSLLNYLDYENLNEDYIKDEEISKVRGMLNYLDYCYSHLPDLKNLTDDENLCTICYAYLKNTKFIPCGHMTCHLCINRHLLNTKECFFCKKIINEVVNIDDTSENLFKDPIKQLGS